MYIKTRDNTNLFVKVWGEGKPVVLIHGWPLTSSSWDPIAHALAEAGHKVIAYDRRGFGRSDQPWNGYDYDTLADDLADVLHGTHVERDATLVGFSMGGGEVVRYMSRYQGEKVARIALISSVVPLLVKTPDNPHGVPQEGLAEMAQGIKKDRAAFMKNFLADFYGKSVKKNAVSDEVIEWSWTLCMHASLRSTLACADSFATTNFHQELDAIKVPALIIHGTQDATVPIEATSRLAAEGIAQAHLIEYEGAPHGLLVTEEQRVIEDLMRFL